MRGSSASDTGISVASTITTAINQRAEARLVALDIKGASDSVWWKDLLAHLWSVGFQLLLEFLREQYGPLPYLIYISANFLLLWSTP